jgi:hypothetical protein
MDAPIGYSNRITESGKKYIDPKDIQGDIMRWAFNELANGKFITEQVSKMAQEKGLKCRKKGLNAGKTIFGWPYAILFIDFRRIPTSNHKNQRSTESHVTARQQNTKHKKWDKSNFFGLVP